MCASSFFIQQGNRGVKQMVRRPNTFAHEVYVLISDKCKCNPWILDNIPLCSHNSLPSIPVYPVAMATLRCRT